jgi:hypothetical protein
VAYFWSGAKKREAPWGDIPRHLKLRSDVAFVHSALFMMDAVILTDSEILPSDLGFPDRS